LLLLPGNRQKTVLKNIVHVADAYYFERIVITMKLADIAKLRLNAQHLTAPQFKDPKKLVAYMGAMQAQDYIMSKLAVGLRVPGATDAAIEAALDKGTILRTHVLRPTWHFVSADDIYWMLELTAPRIRQAISSMDNYLGLTPAIYKKSQKIFINALEGDKHATRDELVALLQKAKIDTSENRPAHLLMDAEIQGLLCSGAKNGTQRTYAFLPDRVPKKKDIPKEEALAMLAERYFNSHGPATLKDFTWWSGLAAKDAKAGLESVRSSLSSETVDTETYYFSSELNQSVRGTSVHLIPGYDEFLISYKDRSPSLELVHNRKVVSINGIFRPTLVVNGQVIGLWKMASTRTGIDLTIDSFEEVPKPVQSKVKTAAKTIQHFYDKPVSLSFTSTHH
jgi:hypothetical protein